MRLIIINLMLILIIMPYVKRKRTLRKKVPYKRRAIARKPRKMAIKTMIKREIAKNIENKVVNLYNSALSIYPSTNVAFNNQIVPVSPYGGFLSISQGLGQGQRTANKNVIKKLTLQGQISCKGYDATTNTFPRPHYVIFWLLYNKQTPSSFPSIDNTFLQLGSASQALTNTCLDVQAPINTDLWCVKKKLIFKMGCADNAGTGGVPGQQYFANNDFKFANSFNINLLPYVVKNIDFNDTSTTPNNRALFWAMTCVSAQVADSYTATQTPSAVAYNLQCEYEDA